jgi:hypothetical protein
MWMTIWTGFKLNVLAGGKKDGIYCSLGRNMAKVLV